MKDNYDFSKGERGKYAKKYKSGTNVVVLDPEIASIFKDSASVNDALRSLVRVANLTGQLAKKARKKG